MLKRLLVWTLGLTLLLGATVAPAGAADSATAPAAKPAVGGQLNLPLENAPQTFHPFYVITNSGTPTVSEQVYASLWEFNERWEPTPYIARSWTISPDGLTWTVNLRQDVRFHDGTPLTADDVAYTLNALKALGMAGEWSGDKLDTVTATDRYTVSIRLNKPAPWLPGDINVGIVKQATPTPTLADLAKQPAAPRERPIGAGPYRFVEYSPGYAVVLERNPDWFMSSEKGGAPFIQRLVYLYTGSSAVTTRAMARGALDMAPVPTWKLPAARRAQVNAYQYNRWVHAELMLNNTRTHLKSKAVRQALAYGLNRQALIDANVPGSTLLRSIIPEESWAFDPAVKPLGYDPAKARLLLEQEGYVMSETGIYEKDGQPLKLELLTSQSAVAAALAPTIRRQWLEIGVDASIKTAEFNSQWNDYINPGKYDISLVYLTLGFDPDPYSEFHSRAVDELNQSRYSNPVVDLLLEKGRLTADLTARKSLYATVQQQINDDAPVIPLYSQTGYTLVSSKVKGAAFQARTGPAYLYRWWIEEQK